MEMVRLTTNIREALLSIYDGLIRPLYEVNISLSLALR